MKLTPPKHSTFYIALILEILAVLGYFVTIPFVTAYGFWIAVIGYVILALGNYMKGF